MQINVTVDEWLHVCESMLKERLYDPPHDHESQNFGKTICQITTPQDKTAGSFMKITGSLIKGF